jgi:hypothetical protein
MAKRVRKSSNLLIPASLIEQRIYLIRGCRVMLDRDLAELYKVKPIALRQQVKRNQSRFPDDFMFQLTADEADALVSQFVIPSHSIFGGSLPCASSEQGVAHACYRTQKPTRRSGFDRNSPKAKTIVPVTARLPLRRRLNRA